MSVVTYQRGDTTALSKNFTRDEFECQCGKCTAQMIDTELVDKLQRIRDVLGVPLKITSGYRCIPHNAAVKGSSGSKHRYGMAADWRTASTGTAVEHLSTPTPVARKQRGSAPRRASTPAPPT